MASKKTYFDGTSETNAYSCCRLLWSRDRKGRRTLRSAVTGEDTLYWAEEDVWLNAVQTNGHRITQHFCDALGCETNTVVCVGTTEGEATASAASVGHDGWNLIEERETHTNGTVTTTEYVWGKDVSGSLEGAGGVGGLLYVKRGESVHVPLCDQGGNIVAYVDGATGSHVAEYEYDGFGNTVDASGTLAETFRFRYSTKYTDSETGLIYYGYRYYAPSLGRWLTRDPLEEAGGLNLYAFCSNNGVNRYDADGRSYFNGLIEQARNVWRTDGVAQFRKRGWNWGATFLLHSLQNNPSRWDFTKGGFISALQGHEDFRKIIANLVNSQKKNFDEYTNHYIPIEYKSGDMKVTVGHAEVYVTGTICKSRGKIKLDVLVKDTYDFHLRWFPVSSKEDVMIFAGNTAAWLDQVTGAIVPYEWTASFKEEN